MNPQATLAGARLHEIVGSPNVTRSSQELSAYSVDGLVPQAAARPGTVQEVSELVKLAAAENLAVIATGARTKLNVGMPPLRYDLAIDLSRFDRVISYDPGDLTLSVEPGIPLIRLAEILAEHNQFLPLQVPFYERATVGGTLASGLDSPLRQGYGAPRDFVLGMEFVTGEGALAKSGGRVVKNVTGYDLHKLMLGAIGSLGVITRVNFKTFPLPRMPVTFLVAFRSPNGASRFNQSVQKSTLRPQAADIVDPAVARILNSVAESEVFPGASADPSWYVAIKTAGYENVITRYHQELERLARSADRDSLRSFEKLSDSQGECLWAAIREFPAAVLRSSPEAVICKVSRLPSGFTAHFDGAHFLAQRHSATVAHVARGAGVCYSAFFNTSGAQLRGLCSSIFEESATSPIPISPVTILWCPAELKRALSIWGPPREDFFLMQRVKQAFDPRGIFSPGRFVGGL